MILKRMELDFFRNYVHGELIFSPGVNVIWGENAQGKTNLLEAAGYLSSCRSHRARYDRELIQFGVDHAFIKGEVFSRQRDFTLEARLHRGERMGFYGDSPLALQIHIIQNLGLHFPAGQQSCFLNDSVCQC